MGVPSGQGRLLGLAGHKRCGKNTFASVLETNGWALDSFAAPIRRFMSDTMGETVEGLERLKEAPHIVLGGRSPRQVMQTLGTEWMRAYCGQDVWIRALEARVLPMLQAGLDVCVFDVRFDNEARFIQRRGGAVVWIHRPGCEPDGHSSEAGLSRDSIDYWIANDRDAEYLQRLAAVFAAMSEP